MNWAAAEEILKDQPAYRAGQVMKAVFADLIDDWEQNTTLPRALREELARVCPLEIRAAVKGAADSGAPAKYSSDHQTEKALLTFSDGLQAETVLMRHHSGRMTVCVSSQVGCPLKCAFCATGQLGFKRNLTAGEIIAQVLFFARRLKNENERVNNIVFMGMGEPFLNYEEVWRAIRVLNHPQGQKIGARHISISTVGIPEGIKKMADENLQVNLAISLHASNDQIRQHLMPVAKQYSLQEILSATEFYLKKTNRRVMFEYLLLKGANDSEAHARELADLLHQSMRVPSALYMVNLLTYNPACGFQPSSPATADRFAEILEENHIAATHRASLGGAIDAACGQLAGRN